MTKGLIHLLVSNEYRIVAINQGHGSPKRVAQWVCLWAERLVVQWGDLAEHSCLPTRFSLRRNRPSPCPPALLQEAGKPRAHTGLRSLHTGPSGLAAIPLLIPTPPPPRPPAAGSKEPLAPKPSLPASALYLAFSNSKNWQKGQVIPI